MIHVHCSVWSPRPGAQRAWERRRGRQAPPKAERGHRHGHAGGKAAPRVYIQGQGRCGPTGQGHRSRPGHGAGRHSQVPSEQGGEGGRANAAARGRARPRAREASVGEATLQPPTRVYIQGRDSAGRARVGSSGAIAGPAARIPTHTSAPGEILTRVVFARQWSTNGGGACPGEGAQCAPRTPPPTSEPVKTHFMGGPFCGRPPRQPLRDFLIDTNSSRHPTRTIKPCFSQYSPTSTHTKATMQKREGG